LSYSNPVMLDFNNIHTQLYIIGCSLVAWTVLFLAINHNVYFSKLSKKENEDIKNRIVSTIHGLYAFGLIGYHLYRDRPEYGTLNTPIQQIIILTSAGYVIYDTIACIYYKIFDTQLIIHHGLVLFGYWATQYYGYSSEGLTGLFYAEASNAPMHLRVIVKTFKMRYTAIYEFLEIVYLSVYIFARGILGTILFVNTWMTPETPLSIKFSCSGIWTQSAFYISTMFDVLKRKLIQFNERRIKQVSYWWLSENPKLSNLSYYRREIRDKIF